MKKVGTERVEGALRKLSAKAELVSLCWVDGADEGLNFCQECAEKYAQQQREKYPHGEFSVVSRWGFEEDGCRLCEDCGRHLAYSLTGAGVESEMDHFLSCCNFARRRRPPSPIEAYELLQVVETGKQYLGGERGEEFDKGYSKLIKTLRPYLQRTMVHA